MSEWQPIETAPKDGAPVMVWCDLKWVIAHWSYSFRNWLPDGMKPDDDYKGVPAKEVGHWYADINGEAVDDGTHDHFLVSVTPTHWMPLPPPPTA